MTKKQLYIDKKKEGSAKKQKFALQRGIIEEMNRKLASLSSLKLKDKVQFFRLLTTMINAGISITKALNILHGQIDTPKLKYMVEDMEEAIREGGSFSSALEKFPNDFSESEIGMIQAGEMSGKLNITLINLATQAEKSDSITKKVKGALIYPVAILIILVIAFIAVIVLVIPQIKDMFESFGAELPLPTQILINTSDFLMATGGPFGLNNVINLLGGLGVLIFGLLSFKKTTLGTTLFDYGVLKIPLFGSLVQKVSIAKMTRGISILLSSGIPMIKSLTICASMIGNEKYKMRMIRIAEDVKIGINIADNIRNDYEYFPPLVISMIGVGEQTANLDGISLKIAELYEEDIEETIKTMTSLLEPLIIVVVGLAVGGLVMAIMMPILTLSDLAG
jgi:type IV pilus assembly protein PilC